MWARVIEFMIACWLSISPFIFRYPKDALFFWVNDLSCSSAIAFFALISFYPQLRKMHLCNLLVSFYLVGICYVFQGNPLSEPIQNYFVLALLLFMLALIPTEASEPPKPWRDFYKS